MFFSAFEPHILFKQESVSVEELSDERCHAKILVLKTNICLLRSEASGANMLVLRTSNFPGTTIRSTLLAGHKHYFVFVVQFKPIRIEEDLVVNCKGF